MTSTFVWIARDGNGELWAFSDEPKWIIGDNAWIAPGGDSRELWVDWFPEIVAGQRVRFVATGDTEHHDVPCQYCGGTGSIKVDFEHPQWITCESCKP